MYTQSQPWVRSILSVLAIASAFGSTGCATLFKGASSEMKIDGLPDGAAITTPDGLPARLENGETVKLAAQNAPNYVVVKSRAGEQKVRVDRFPGAGWIVVDILAGFVPVVVDAATGNWYEFTDTSMAEAAPVEQPAVAPEVARATPAPVATPAPSASREHTL